jgi:hypothetical protein
MESTNCYGTPQEHEARGPYILAFFEVNKMAAVRTCEERTTLAPFSGHLYDNRIRKTMVICYGAIDGYNRRGQCDVHPVLNYTPYYEGIWGVEVWLHAFLILALGGISDQLHFLAALYPGGKAYMKVVEKRKISWPLPRIEPRFRGSPAHSSELWKTYLISGHTTKLGRLPTSPSKPSHNACVCMYVQRVK